MKNHVKYLVMDVDGTLTDGKIYMGNECEQMKAFDIKDGYGIHCIAIPAGIEPIVITGRKSSIVEKRCKELGIEQIFQGVKDKTAILDKIVSQSQYNEVAYLGDDLIDLPCMKAIKAAGGIVGCPRNSANEVLEMADFISTYKGGEGVAREFIEWLLADHEFQKKDVNMYSLLPSDLLHIVIAEYTKENERSNSLDYKTFTFIISILAILVVLFQQISALIIRFANSGQGLDIFTILLCLLFLAFLNIGIAIIIFWNTLKVKGYKEINLRETSKGFAISSDYAVCDISFTKYYKIVTEHNRKVNDYKEQRISKGFYILMVGSALMVVTIAGLIALTAGIL